MIYVILCSYSTFSGQQSLSSIWWLALQASSVLQLCILNTWLHNFQQNWRKCGKHDPCPLTISNWQWHNLFSWCLGSIKLHNLSFKGGWKTSGELMNIWWALLSLPRVKWKKTKVVTSVTRYKPATVPMTEDLLKHPMTRPWSLIWLRLPSAPFTLKSLENQFASFWVGC